jgi:hypothetical protein
MFFCLNAHPSCNRLLDPIPLAFRRHAKNKEWIPGSRKLQLYSMLLTANRHQLCDGMIAISILLFTGWVRRFADFHLAQEHRFMLPGINTNEINQFLEYTTNISSRTCLWLGFWFPNWWNSVVRAGWHPALETHCTATGQPQIQMIHQSICCSSFISYQ